MKRFPSSLKALREASNDISTEFRCSYLKRVSSWSQRYCFRSWSRSRSSPWSMLNIGARKFSRPSSEPTAVRDWEPGVPGRETWAPLGKPLGGL